MTRAMRLNDRRGRRGGRDAARGGGVDGAFACVACGRVVPGETAGSRHRNHCPWCLTSLHVDLRPGDRACPCRGAMEPVAVWVRGGGEWALIHRCRRCGALRSNRVAGDDDEGALLALARRPLAETPFPVRGEV